MTHSDISKLFIKWFSKNYPGWNLFQNNSGYASAEKVHYGLPSCGGGFDFFAFGPDAQTEFFEIKTIGHPRLQENQKTFMDEMAKNNFECWVVKELPEEPFFYIKEAHLYRPTKSWPY